MDPEKETPNTSSGQTEEIFGDEISGHNLRIARYSKAKKHQTQLTRYIYDNFEKFTGRDHFEIVDAYKNLNDCGNYLLFRHYYTVGKVALTSANFCKKHLLCQLCAIRRGARSLREYLRRLDVVKRDYPSLKLSMMTLTIKNGPELLERVEHLLDGIRLANQRMRNARRRKTYSGQFRHILGYVGSIEVKRGRGSGQWHPHCHVIIAHEVDIDSRALADEWQSITGDSYIVDVQPFRHPDRPEVDFCEVFKYAVKFSSMSPADVLHAWICLRGRRLVFSGGLFRGVKIPDDLRDEPLSDDLPFIELLYSYLGGAYSLTSHRVQSSGVI